MSTITATESAPARTTRADIPSFLELEITQFCQLNCAHCYSESGPHAGRGTMTAQDWERVIDQAAALRVETVQFMGGCLCARRVPYRSCLIYSGSSEQKKSCPDLTAGGELRAHACAWRKSWLALRAACGEVSMSR